MGATTNARPFQQHEKIREVVNIIDRLVVFPCFLRRLAACLVQQSGSTPLLLYCSCFLLNDVPVYIDRALVDNNMIRMLSYRYFILFFFVVDSSID